MLPTWDGKGLPTPRYGNIANDLLLKRMLSLGCSIKHLSVAILGGNDVMGGINSSYQIGQQNIDEARAFLNDRGLKAFRTNIGGKSALKVNFNTKSGDLKLTRMNSKSPLPGLTPS